MPDNMTAAYYEFISQIEAETPAQHASYGLPDHGWNLTSVEDLGADLRDHHQCDYCKREWVRYLHELHHPSGNWPVLHVGCVCSGRLTGDPRRAEEHDKRARRISTRRANWLDLRGWRPGRNGKLLLRKDGMVFVLTPGRFGGFSGSYKDADDVWHSVEGWLDLDEAKMALFEAAYVASESPSGRVAA